MIEVDFIVEKCEMRSDIHEITAETEKPFQDHFWKDHFCDPGIAFADRLFLQHFPLVGKLYSFCLYYLCLVSSSVVIAILNRPMDSSFKMAWIIPVLLIPIFGIILYVFVQVQFQTRALARRVNLSVEKQNLILFRTHRCRSGCGQPVCVEAVW